MKAAATDPTAARREFDGQLMLEEESRDAWGWEALDRGSQNLHCAFRMLRKNAAFTAVALPTLATTGIGANTVIFTVVHAVLLASLPYQ